MDENEQKEPMTEPAAEAEKQTQEEIKKEEPKQADTKQEDEKNSQRASGCGRSAI